MNRWFFAFLVLTGAVFWAGCVHEEKTTTPPVDNRHVVKEVARELPQDIHWVTTPNGLFAMALSDLQYPYFAEFGPDGALLHIEQIPVAPGSSHVACEGQADKLSTLWRELIWLNNQVTSGTRLPSDDELASHSQSGTIGLFARINLAALFFASNRLAASLDAQAGRPGILNGALSAGTKSNNVTLTAMVGSYKYVSESKIRSCLLAELTSSTIIKGRWSTFKAGLKRGHTARAYLFTGALVGMLAGLRLREVTWDANAEFSTGAQFEAEARVSLDQSNISLSYVQAGKLREGTGADSLLAILRKENDPVRAINALDAATERMAIIGLIPEELALP